MLLALVPFALAESQSVQGTGAIKKMSVNNGDNEVVVKLKGMDTPCEAHYFKVVLFWGKKKAYQADAGCYQRKWIPSLYYHSNRNSGQGGEPVKCEKFKIAYDKDKGPYRIFVPASASTTRPTRSRCAPRATTTRRRCRARRVRLRALARG